MLRTAKEVAERLRIGLARVYDLKDEIGHVRIGGRVRFTQDDVNNFITGHRVARTIPAAQVRTRKLR